jgi:hypothetical protein
MKKNDFKRILDLSGMLNEASVNYTDDDLSFEPSDEEGAMSGRGESSKPEVRKQEPGSTVKVVISETHGGFSISNEAVELLAKKKGINPDDINDREIDRTDADLIEVIEELGSDVASGRSAELYVIEIPSDVEYVIHEYDGLESIHEKHRVWNSRGLRDSQ